MKPAAAKLASKLTIVLLAFLASAAAYAGAAKIVATDTEGKKLNIALDAKGMPRSNGDANTSPTIKTFRDTGDFDSYCYNGQRMAVAKLLEALVEAADGDGDSYAELVSLEYEKNRFTLTAKITDESGENEETYVFRRCKKGKTAKY